MNKSKINLFILLFALSLIAGALTLWKLFLVKKPVVSPPPTTAPTPTPTSAFYPLPLGPEKGDSLEEIYQETLKDFPLFDHVPYITEKFVVDYTAPLHLKVFLKNDTPQIRQEVSSWIRSKGVDPATHKIEWIKED